MSSIGIESVSKENEKLQRFSRAVYQEADSKIEEILAEAERSKSEIIEQTTDKSLAEAYDKIKIGMKKIQNRYVKLVSGAELDAKREVLVHRERLAVQTFENVRHDLMNFVQSDEYEKWLIKTAKQVVEEFGKKSGTINLRPDDMRLADKLCAILEGCKAEPLKSIKLGGFSVYYECDSVLCDKTFDSAIEEQRALFNRSTALKING